MTLKWPQPIRDMFRFAALLITPVIMCNIQPSQIRCTPSRRRAASTPSSSSLTLKFPVPYIHYVNNFTETANRQALQELTHTFVMYYSPSPTTHPPPHPHSPNALNLSNTASASPNSLIKTSRCLSLLTLISHSNFCGRILNPCV